MQTRKRKQLRRRHTKRRRQQQRKQRGGWQETVYINEPGFSVAGSGNIPGLSIASKKALIRSEHCTPTSQHP